MTPTEPGREPGGAEKCPSAAADALPLAGITVLDFTQVFMGPCCTQMLGDFGADVIKIEKPGTGDSSRGSFPDDDGPDNPIFQSINRNKRGLCLDTKSGEGRAVIHRMIEKADVMVSNFRAGVMERLGLGYEEAKKHNPRIIWASGTGFGTRGPYAAKGGQDVVNQAYSGVLWRRSSDEDPLSVYPTTLCDYTTGMHLFQGILLALRRRAVSGLGQRVEVSMYDSMLHMQMQEAAMQLNRGREVNWGRMPLTGVFPTADSAICIVGGFTPDPLRHVAAALGLPEELADRPEFATLEKRFENRAALQQVLAERFREGTTADWEERLEREHVLNAPVRTLAQALEDQQTAANRMIVTVEHPATGPVRLLDAPIHLSQTPASVRRPAPRLGEHNAQILRENGYGDQEIRRLEELGVLR